MENRDSEFLKRIQATFRIEAEEHLKAFSAGLIELEKETNRDNLAGIIETMFREVHSLKGAARSVDQKEIESVCQPLENLFSALKRQETILSQEIFELFYKTARVLSKLITTGKATVTTGERENIRALIQQIKHCASGTDSNGPNSNQSLRTEGKTFVSPIDFPSEVKSLSYLSMQDKPILPEGVRIPISKLDPLLLQAEELLQTKVSINQLIRELDQILEEVAKWKYESVKWSGRRTSASINQWNEWYDEYELRLGNLEDHLKVILRSVERDEYSFEQMLNGHLDAMKQILMLPVSSLVETFPVMVREIALDHQKEIEFVIIGAELEIDKRILEELKDPLIHLIRNSIDHGIGRPRDRMLLNKPPRGKITLSFVAKESGLVEIAVSDDGNGIDRDQVLAAALKLNILSKDSAEKMGSDEILSLIFQSGVSTSAIITDLSGRGLGLSIVQEKVEKLNGRLSMETEAKKGTTFRILLPMTLTTFRGILVSLGDSLFLLPTINVEKVLRVVPEDIKTIENYETILINDEVLPVMSLAGVLGIRKVQKEESRFFLAGFENMDYLRVVVLISGESRMAFMVDEVLGEHQVLVKGLGKLLKRVRNISGATIIGSGRIVPVLYVADLMKSAVRTREKIKETSDEKSEVITSGKILVAEDSITSRTLLKNILETAGYQVTTAVDGADAYAHAKSEAFDLIVSDVDMPRMNGFELTAKIRNDKELSETPVVLVTALESQEDREHGIDVGADAYIIKSSFDQGNLLEVIKKLI